MEVEFSPRLCCSVVDTWTLREPLHLCLEVSAVGVRMFSCLLSHQVQTLSTSRLILNLDSGV